MSKKPEATAWQALLAQTLATDARKTVAMKDAQAALADSLINAVATLTELMQSEDASAGVRLGAAQSLLRSACALEQAEAKRRENEHAQEWDLFPKA